MLRSLRSRHLLLTGAVAGVALVAAGLVSRVAVRTEFHRLETSVRGDGLASAAEFLSARFATPEEALHARRESTPSWCISPRRSART